MNHFLLFLIVVVMILSTTFAQVSEFPISFVTGSNTSNATEFVTSPDHVTWKSSLGDDRQDCVDYINQFRASKGLPALQRKYDAESCVDQQADYDFLHPNPAHAAFGKCQENAQCECPKWPNNMYVTKCIDQMIAEGPMGGHYRILVGNYKYVACGYGGIMGGAWTGDFDFWM